MICFHCGKNNIVVELVGRGDSCFSCGFDLRTCKNCQHYDIRAYNECREPASDRVVNKEKSNFCDFFKPNAIEAGHRSDPAKILDPKAAAEALFKKK